jgi:membrane-associated phospholipid phosphatase
MGQHWASDALAGYTLGLCYLLLVIELYRAWMRRHPKKREPAVPESSPT